MSDSIDGLHVAIGGDSSQLTEALESAIGKLGSFGDIAEAAKELMTGPVGLVVAFGLVAKVLGDLENEFAGNQKSDLLFNAALEGSKKASDDFSDSAIDAVDSIMKMTGATDDTAKAMITTLVSTGRTSEQITLMTHAAEGLANATNVSLDTAFSQLNATFSGSIGKMGKLNPELQSLTKEQLLAGDAVAMLDEKYGKYAGVLEHSADVSLKRSTIATEELKAALGSFVNDAVQPGRDAMTALTNDLTGFINSLNDSRSPLEKQNENMIATKKAVDDILGPISSLSGAQYVNATQIAALVKVYPELTGVMNENNTTVAQAAKLADEARIKNNNAIIQKELELQAELLISRTHSITSIKQVSNMTEEQAQKVYALTTAYARQVETGQSTKATTDTYAKSLLDLGLISDTSKQSLAGVFPVVARVSDYVVGVNDANKALKESKDRADAAKKAISDLTVTGTTGHATMAKSAADSNKKQAESNQGMIDTIRAADQAYVLLDEQNEKTKRDSDEITAIQAIAVNQGMMDAISGADQAYLLLDEANAEKQRATDVATAEQAKIINQGMMDAISGADQAYLLLDEANAEKQRAADAATAEQAIAVNQGMMDTLNAADQAYVVLDAARADAVKAKQEETANRVKKTWSDAYDGIQANIKSFATSEGFSAIDAMGKVIKDGGTAFEGMEAGLRGFVAAFVDKLPNLLLQAGLALCSNPATMLAGVALIAASGLVELSNATGFTDVAGSELTKFGNKVGGDLENFFSFDWLADGTDYAPGGPTIVGERGPELINLPRGSQVIPNDKIGMGEIHFHSPVAIDANQASLLLTQTKRQLAFEAQ